MKDFPQELVDEVIGRLFDIVEKDNRWQGSSRRFCPGWHGISRYSLVSRAWVSPTQKHHFNHLHLDSPSATNRWRVRIPFDPTGVSRHVRKLVLGDLDLSDFEGFEAYMRAFIQVESLTVIDCTGVSLYVTMEWFLPMKSSMVELQVGELSATPLTITSLLAALPLLNCVEIYELRQSDNETTPPATTRIPFFEGANRLTLCSFDNRSCPEGLLDWIPPSARFGHLDIDTECALHHPDLVNQWLASSCETLTNLTIRWGEPSLFPNKPKSLDLSPCTSLEFLKIPIWPFAEMILPHLTSSRLAKVILYWNGGADQGTVKVDNNTRKAIEKYLCPIAKAYNHAYPERKMVLEILTGPVLKHRGWRMEVPRILDDEKFMSQLKEEAEVVVRQIG